MVSILPEHYEVIEDIELIRLSMAGSREAFEILVRRYQVVVRWSVSRYLREASTVDDLAQDVFLYAYQHLAEYRGVGSLRSWLIGIARNMARQHVRSDSRRRQREAGPLAVQLAQWRIDRLENEPMDGEEEERVFAALGECIDVLGPESRKVVQDHYFRRQTLESIARRQRRGAGAVRMMLFRIRKALRECIHEKLRDQD